MSYYLTSLYQDVAQRLKADATLLADLDGDGVYVVEAPETDASGSRVATYVVMQASSVTTESEALRTLARDVRLSLTMVVPRNHASGSPLSVLGRIAERIEGDWYAHAFGGPPTYGLARWQPTLDTWDCTPLRLIESTLLGDSAVIGMGMTYAATITREAT